MAENTRFVEAESRFQGRYSSNLFDTLHQAYAPFLGRTLLWLLLGFLGRLSLLVNVNLVGYWVDSFCSAPLQCKPVPRLLTGFGLHEYLIALSIATGVGFALTALFRVGFSRLSALAVSRIYDETTLRTSRLPMEFFDRNPAGRVITRFSSDYNNIFRIFGGPMAEFIALVFDLIGMSLLLLVASAWYLPFWILIAGLNFYIYRLNLPALRRERRELALKRSPGIAHFAETSQGVATIRAFGKQANFLARFRALNDAFLSQRLTTQTFLARFALQMGSLTAIVFLATALCGAWLIASGRTSVGSIGVAFAYIGLSGNVLQSFFEWLAQFEEAMTGLERLDHYLRLPLESGGSLPATAEFETHHPLAGAFGAPQKSIPVSAEIEIHDLVFRYRHDLPAILQGISLRIAPGERIAIVGRTGSGKTSLIQALFRLYPIESGSIRIAGQEPETVQLASPEASRSGRVNLASYRRLIALISQEPTLFRGTLRENLSVNPDQSDADLLQALERVQFFNFGNSRLDPGGFLDTEVEERGRNLSAGERQLVCMARCLLQDAPVVVLDEATSAVDPRSEEILTRATEEFFAGKTQLIIAHRLSTVRGCDRVLWLQGGKIHRLGRPAEVLPEFEQARLLPAD